MASVTTSSSNNNNDNDGGVKLLQSFHDAPSLAEDDVLKIFSFYDSLKTSSTWSMTDFRRFLSDLAASFNAPRVVPDEALVAALGELHMGDSSMCVTWIEFKSYTLYLQARPLHELFTIIQQQIPQNALQHAVLVQQLPRGVTNEHVNAHFGGGCVHVFVNEVGCEALLTFPHAEAQTAACNLTNTRILEATIVVRAFEPLVDIFPTSTVAPATVAREPSAVATTVAKVYVGVRALDERTQLSEKVKAGVAYVTEHVQRFSEEHQLREKMNRITVPVGQKVKDVDNKYQLTATASVASQVVKGQVARVMEQPTVQKATEVLGKMADAVKQGIDDFKSETKVAVDRELAASGGGGDADDAAAAAAPREEFAMQ